MCCPCGSTLFSKTSEQRRSTAKTVLRIRSSHLNLVLHDIVWIHLVPGHLPCLVEIYCVTTEQCVTTPLWSRGGSAVVSVHPPAARMESRMWTRLLFATTLFSTTCRHDHSWFALQPPSQPSAE